MREDGEKEERGMGGRKTDRKREGEGIKGFLKLNDFFYIWKYQQTRNIDLAHDAFMVCKRGKGK